MPARFAEAQDAFLLPLERCPVLPSTAMPFGLECTFDEDGNGLDDDVETAIAQAFVPEFRFDVAENATLQGEPRALYNAHVATASGPDGSFDIEVRYVFVWHYDGGFVSDDAPACWTDDHPGDTQPMNVWVRVSPGLNRWYARMLSIGGFEGHGPLYTDRDPRVARNDRGHPLVYPTAGKHHFRPAPGEYNFEVTGPGSCSENAYGNGLRVIPVVEHAPHQNMSLVQGDWGPYWIAEQVPGLPRGFPPTTLVDGRRRFVNVCEYRKGKQAVPATRSLRPEDLSGWGYFLNGPLSRPKTWPASISS